MSYGLAQGADVRTRHTIARAGFGGNRPRGGRPPERQPLSPGARAARILAAALACLVALSFSCTPLALATTGVTSDLDADMDYYWASSQAHAKHYLHKLGDWWVYCVDPFNVFKEGLTYTGEDPVKTGKLSQECVTDMALAYKYVWDEGLYRTPQGEELANDYERYAAAQVLIWSILVDYYPSLGPHHNRITVKGKNVTGDGDEDENNKAAYRWIAAHRDDYIGHCEYFDAGNRQSFAMSFTAESLSGSIALVKHSSNADVTGGNPRYSLEDARYGVYADSACTDLKGTLVTDASGKAQIDDVPIGTYYVKETKAPSGFALDGSTYTVQVKSGTTVYVGGSAGVVDVAQSGSVTLSKTSSNISMTKNNACYSLANAEYGIYSDGACTKRVGLLETDEKGKARVDGMPLGTYYVKETKAPTGFALDATVYTVVVNADETCAVNGNGGISDAPQYAPIEVFATKRDAQSPEGMAQGSATLAGAQFTVDYYDGYYSADGLPSSPTRSWVFETDGNGCARADDGHLVGGDALYRSATDSVALPLGTYRIRETAAPEGYLLGGGDGSPESHIAHVKADGKTAELLSCFDAVEQADYVKRGGVSIGKVDRQNGQFLAQGAATLEGASFEIVNDSDKLVVVDGHAFAPGAVVKTIQTTLQDGLCVASTASDCLPVGSYTVREVASTEGYLFDEESASWKQSFTIDDDGMVADFTEQDKVLGNLVIRGDFEFSKIEGQNAQRLAGVPFLVTSDTTGEAHVLVTDENGMASTASEWNAHTQDTNANDAAVSEQDGKVSVDESLLNPSAGIWFDGRTDASCEPNDDLGALPFDSYTISELPCQANEGLELVSFTTVISRNNRELDLGTVNDQAGPVIATSLTDSNGSKLVSTTQDAVLVDTVSYANLDTDRTYTLTGQLHAVDGDGQDMGVVAEGSTELHPDVSTGSVEVHFSFDASNLEACRLVAFEQLAEKDGIVICSHEDLEDQAQSVYVPVIGTELKIPGDKQVISSVGTIELVDTVSYSGLAPARTYVLEASLHLRGDDGQDQGVLEDANGQPVIARQSFTPAESEGEVLVSFLFEAPGIAGKTVVAFEELYFRDVSYAVHADISDEAQTVTFPKIATTLEGDSGAKEVKGTENLVLIDTVSFENLVPDKRYTLMGTLHLTDGSGQDLGVLRDGNGTPVSAKALFTPSEANGSANVKFHVDASDACGMNLVAFETLLDEDEHVIASHEDASDEAQTVYLDIEEQPDEEIDEPEDVIEEDVEEEDKEKDKELVLTAPKEKPKTPVKQTSKQSKPSQNPSPKTSTVAKTGDPLKMLAIALVPAGALALGLASLAVRHMRRSPEVPIPRGKHQRLR